MSRFHNKHRDGYWRDYAEQHNFGRNFKLNVLAENPNQRPKDWLEATKRHLYNLKIDSQDYAADKDEKGGLRIWKILKPSRDFSPLSVHWAEFDKGEIGIARSWHQFFILKNSSEHGRFFENVKNADHYKYYVAKECLPDETVMLASEIASQIARIDRHGRNL